MKAIHVPLDLISTKAYLLHSTYDDLKTIVEELDTEVDISCLIDCEGGQVDNVIWIDSSIEFDTIAFTTTLVHETSHYVDFIMEALNLEGTEIRAYMSDFIVTTVLASYEGTMIPNSNAWLP